MTEQEFYDKYWRYVWKIAVENKNRWNNSIEVEDYVQEIFICLLRAFRDQGSQDLGYPFVWRVARTSCIKARREHEKVLRCKRYDYRYKNPDRNFRSFMSHMMLNYDTTEIIDFDENGRMSDTKKAIMDMNIEDNDYDIDLYKRDTIREVVSRIKSDRDRDMFLMHLEGHYKQDIGREYGLTRERARQIIRDIERDAIEYVQSKEVSV